MNVEGSKDSKDNFVEVNVLSEWRKTLETFDSIGKGIVCTNMLQAHPNDVNLILNWQGNWT